MGDYELKFGNVNRKYSKNINMSNLNRGIAWKEDSAVKHRELAERYSFTGQRDRCPICEGSKHEVFVNIYGYDYAECSNCNHIYLKTLINKDDIKELYSGTENKNLQHMVYLDEELFNKRISEIADPKTQWISDEINKNGLWVDIGCGTGEILFSANKKGFSVRGIDSDEKEIEFAISKGIDAVCDYITESNINKYVNDSDIVSLFNVLEHLEDPSTFLKNISDNIKLGSYVVIEVPKHPSISSLNNLVFDEVACRHIYPPDHMHIFTEKSLELMFSKANLVPISIWNFGQDAYDFIITALARKNIEPSKFTNKILESAPLIQKGIDEAGLSDTVIVICRKS